MSYMQNASWTPSEKVDLLVSVLRSNIPDLPFFLMQILHEKGIYPKWNDTPLPAGRSLASSQIIYEEMGRPFKQQGPYNVQPLGGGHVPPIAPAIPGRRPFSEYEPFTSQQPQQQQQQQQRTLQPRPPRSTDSPIPPNTNGEPPTVMRPLALPEPTQEPQRKKRGRPSKEEAEERDRALAAEGKVYQPKKRPAKKIRPSLETPQSSRTSDVSPLVIRTPPVQTSDLQEDGFAEKRMGEQHSREEADLVEEIADGRTDLSAPGAQSPSDRLLATHRERDLDMLLTRSVARSPTEPTAKSEKKE